jgi:hypothetical protein
MTDFVPDKRQTAEQQNNDKNPHLARISTFCGDI